MDNAEQFIIVVKQEKDNPFADYLINVYDATPSPHFLWSYTLSMTWEGQVQSIKAFKAWDNELTIAVLTKVKFSFPVINVDNYRIITNVVNQNYISSEWEECHRGFFSMQTFNSTLFINMVTFLVIICDFFLRKAITEIWLLFTRKISYAYLVTLLIRTIKHVILNNHVIYYYMKCRIRTLSHRLFGSSFSTSQLVYIFHIR